MRTPRRRTHRYHRPAFLILAGTMLYPPHSWAQSGPSAGGNSAPATAPATQPATRPSPETRSTPFTSKAWGAKLETDPPGYVKTVDKLGLKGMDWLEFGAEHRTRFEYRNNDYRRPYFTYDEPFQLRSRGYLGVKKIIDPIRIGFEFNDGRQLNSKFEDTVSDVDENEILQMFGELYFADLLGKDQPARFRFGRMTLDLMDRKLVSRTRWRSDPQQFDGFRLTLGQPTSDWQFDTFAVQPVERRTVQPDHSDEERMFYGIIPTWRKWSKIITLEPYYLILADQWKDRDAADREIHTMGLHAFGPIGNTGFDWDTNNAFQFGKDGDRWQRSFASSGEVGYTFNHPWKPRLSSWNVYASGDSDPNDGYNERFDNLYGDNHGFSTADLVSWRNLISTKLRLEASPLKNLKLVTSYGGYWLASDSDAWVAVNRRDETGRSGTCIGSEYEAQIVYNIDPHADLEVGYSYFAPGQFTQNTGTDSPESNFFYVSMTVRLP